MTACLLTKTLTLLKIIDRSLSDADKERKNTLKKILSVLLLAVVLFTIAFNRPALAADTANGAKIFSANCAACHMGGRNVVMAGKTLQKAEKWGCGFASPHIFQDRSP